MTKRAPSFLRPVLLVAAATFIYLMNGGIRANFGIMLSAITAHTGLTYASVSFVLAVGQLCFGITQPIFGVVNSSNGLGNTLLTPILSTAIAAGGLLWGTGVLTALVALMFPVILWLCRSAAPAEKSQQAEALPLSELVRLGLSSRDYLFIVIGFFTCGFHMAIITNHLASQIMSYGYTYAQSSYAFSLYGVATIAGALASGAVCSRVSMKDLLGTLYGLRAVVTLVFFLLPKTMPVICLYIMLLGATGAATISPVTGICQRLFGVRGVTIFFQLLLFDPSGGRLSLRLAWRRVVRGPGVLHPGVDGGHRPVRPGGRGEFPHSGAVGADPCVRPKKGRPMGGLSR